MKTTTSILIAALVSAAVLAPNLRAADTKPAPERIGIYDSRAVAFAHFWSDAHKEKINLQLKSLMAAKTAGDKEKISDLNKAMTDEQRRAHRQIFSTEGIGQILAELKDRLPAIQKQSGVSLLISRWDDVSLKKHPKAERVDVTDLLVREFNPDEKQLKIIEELKRKTPMEPEQVDSANP